MEIALQTNMIVIRTQRQMLKQEWVRSFIEAYPDELLFLSHSMIIYDSDEQAEDKEMFLSKACRVFAQKESLNESFFIKAMISCLHYPIKIETKAKDGQHLALNVDVKAFNSHQVRMELSKVDSWFHLYIHTKLKECIHEVQDQSLIFNLNSSKNVSQFERALSRNYIFSQKINFHYDSNFLQTLFRDYSQYEIDIKEKYYAILGCSNSASKDELKSSYKQLVKTYHPDQVMHLNDEKQIVHFTRKFQQVQEAYQMLKGI
jgi:DnaJ-domain-containing protein 1